MRSILVGEKRRMADEHEQEREEEEEEEEAAALFVEEQGQMVCDKIAPTRRPQLINKQFSHTTNFAHSSGASYAACHIFLGFFFCPYAPVVVPLCLCLCRHADLVEEARLLVLAIAPCSSL